MKAIGTNKPSHKRAIYYTPLVAFLMILIAFIAYTAGYAANSKEAPQIQYTNSQRSVENDKYTQCIEDANNPFEHQLLKKSSRSEQEYTQEIEQEISNCDRYR